MATPLHHDQQNIINVNDIETAADAILVDTGTTIPALIGTPAADLAADIAAVKVGTAATLVDTGTTLPATLATLALAADGFQTVSKTITLGLGSVPVTETLFTVTGEVEARVFGYVDTAPTSGGAMTLELGVVGNTAGLIAITAIGELDLDELWTTTTSAVGVQALPTTFLISNSADIQHVIRDFDATAGAITYYCQYRAVSADGAVVAA